MASSTNQDVTCLQRFRARAACPWHGRAERCAGTEARPAGVVRVTSIQATDAWLLLTVISVFMYIWGSLGIHCFCMNLCLSSISTIFQGEGVQLLF